MPRNIQSTITQFHFNHSTQTSIFTVALLIICLFGPPPAAQAQATAVDTIHYNIPQGSLEQALGLFSRQSGIALSSDADKIKGTDTNGLEGAYSVEMGLAALLENSGFTFEKNAVGYVLVQASASNVEPATMPEVKVTGFMDPDSPGNPGYTRTNSSTATKSNLPLMKTPVSVQVIPRAVMEDQQAVQVEDVIKNVSGVLPGFTFGGQFEEFMIRGFRTGFANYRDGFRFQAARISLANIERVEVVKGAATGLYGRIEPGGMINLITKRPQAQSHYSLNQQFGSFGQYQTRADVTGALNESGTLMYRINFEYLNKDSFRDFGFTERYFVAPSVTWKVAPKTQFDLDFMYSNVKSREDYGIVALGNRPARVPRSRFLGEPTQDEATLNLYNTALTFTHGFNDNWQVRTRFSHLLRDSIDPQTFGRSLDEATGILQRKFYGGPNGPLTENTYQGTVDVTGRFHTAGIEHNILAGWEYYGRFGRAEGLFIDANPINIFNPQYRPINLQGVRHNDFFTLILFGTVCTFRIRLRCLISYTLWEVGVMTGRRRIMALPLVSINQLPTQKLLQLKSMMRASAHVRG